MATSTPEQDAEAAMAAVGLGGPVTSEPNQAAPYPDQDPSAPPPTFIEVPSKFDPVERYAPEPGKGTPAPAPPPAGECRGGCGGQVPAPAAPEKPVPFEGGGKSEPAAALDQVGGALKRALSSIPLWLLLVLLVLLLVALFGGKK